MIQPLYNAGFIREAMFHIKGATNEASLWPDDQRALVLWLQQITLLPLIFGSEDDIYIARSLFEENFRQLLSFATSGSFHLAPSSLPAATLQLCYHGKNDLGLIQLVSGTFRRLSPALGDDEVGIMPLRRQLSSKLPNKSHMESIGDNEDSSEIYRIKVTIVSAHFRWHSVCRALCPTFEKLAQLEDIDIIVAFAPTSHMDGVSQRVLSAASGVIYLSSDLAKSRMQLYETASTILLYTDVGMNSWTTSLAHARLAPVQLAMWGHHGSSGLPSIDYYVIADAFEPFQSNSKHSEQLVRMETGLGVYLRRTDFTRRGNRKKGDPISRFDLGIRDNAKLYICAQSLPKFHPSFDYSLRRILEFDSEAVIIVPVDRRGQNGWLSLLKDRLLNSLGIEKRCRIVFCDLLSEESMFELLSIADVSLDTYPVGGGITSLESLGNSVPTVTCAACQSVIRTTSAALTTMGISNLTAGDPDDFARLAVRTANDGDFNSAMRDLLRKRSTLLFERDEVVEEWKGFINQLQKLFI